MEIKTSIVSTKKQDTSYKLSKIKLIEHIREFRLLQQFPSTTKEASLVTWRNKNLTNIQFPTSTSVTTPNGKLKVSNIDYSIPYKKLRIMSPNGRDLGEFNVEVKNDRDNTSKGQILTISKSNSFKPINKPVTISLSPVSCTPRRTLPRILKQESAKIAKNKIVAVTFNDKYVSNNSKINLMSPPKLQSRIMPIKEIFTIDRDTKKAGDTKKDTNKKTQVDNVNISANKESISDKKYSIQCVNHDNKKAVYKPIISVKNNKCTINTHVNTSLKNHKITLAEDNSLIARNVNYKKIAESPFPIVSCMKLAINPNDSNTVQTYFKINKKNFITPSNTENEKILTSVSNALESVQEYNQINKDLTRKDIDSNNKSSHKALQDENDLSHINSNLVYENQMHETKIQKNVMTIIPNKEYPSFNKNYSTLEHNTIIPLANKNMANIDCNKIVHNINHLNCDNKNEHVLMDRSMDNSLNNNIQCVPRSTEIIDINADVLSNEQNDCFENSQKNLSDQWNIIKKAVSSVKDEELRAQALKALADCGIGIERYVPVHLPKKLKAVHDTQVQTTVFGILDPKSFVLINKDLDSIQRIQQVTFHDHISCTQSPLSENNLHCNDPIFKNFNAIDQEIDLDIENFFKQICEENSSALKVKETLSTINTRYNMIIDQLKRDFESVKKYDQNGMLNIHNAVIENNIFDVQRHIIVLKQCKENIDILTEDGVTSLELAIKYDVNNEIAKLLLQAGAQPVISKLMHESALIIAAKKSSVLLPMLINHVTNSKLLDQVDSEGFAALHYCCMHGNLEGVNALLSSNVNINLKDMKSGRTPLFHAVDNKYTKVAEALLYAGAAANIANFAGQTPLPIVNDAKSASFKIFRKD